MIDEAAAIRTENWVNEALDGGAKLVTGGKRAGNFFDPTVLTDTDPEMKVVAEEVFAPVVAVESFDEFSAAVEMANNSKYGLQAGIFSQNAANIEYAAENLEYGGVIVNDAPIFRVDNMPYGGVKASGFGREGVRYAMEEMTEPRLIVYDR
jgi:glyceraldehyde-3-phosphate dehydrogenase (NADP+)